MTTESTPAESTVELAADDEVTFAIVTDAGEKAGVGKGRRFTITPRGVLFHGTPTIEQFAEFLLGMKRGKENYDFVLATAVRQGKELFGIERVAALFKQLEFDYVDAIRALGVGQLSFDFAERPKLSHEHLWVIARSLPDDTEAQAKWAAAAEKHNLSANALQKSITAGRVIKDAELNQQSGGGSGGLTFLHQLRNETENWERKIGGRAKLLELEPELRREWLENDGAYMESLVADVRKSLEGVA